MFNIYNIVFTLKARYDLNCVKSAVKLQPTNHLINRITLTSSAAAFIVSLE